MVVVQHEGPKAGRREFGPGRSTQFRLVLGTCLIRQRHVRTSLHSKSSDLRKLTGWWLNTTTPRHHDTKNTKVITTHLVPSCPLCRGAFVVKALGSHNRLKRGAVKLIVSVGRDKSCPNPALSANCCRVIQEFAHPATHCQVAWLQTRRYVGILRSLREQRLSRHGWGGSTQCVGAQIAQVNPLLAAEALLSAVPKTVR